MCGAIWRGRFGSEPVRIRVIALPERFRASVTAMEEALHQSAIRMRRLQGDPLVAPLRTISREGDRLLVAYADDGNPTADTVKLAPARIHELVIRLLDLVGTMHDNQAFLGAITPKDLRIQASGNRIDAVCVDGIGIAAAFIDLGLSGAFNRIWSLYIPSAAPTSQSTVEGDLESIGKLVSSLLGDAREPDSMLLRNVIDRARRQEFHSSAEMKRELMGAKPVPVATRNRSATPVHGDTRALPVSEKLARAFELGRPTQELQVQKYSRDVEFGAPTRQIEIVPMEIDDQPLSDLSEDWIDVEALVDVALDEVEPRPVQQEKPSREIEIGAPTYIMVADPELIDNYAILRRVGQGAFAKVYQAQHREMERVVAIKLFCPPPQASSDDLDRMKARFKREAMLAGRLTGEFHVPVYDFRTHEGLPLLVMEFVEGETLHEYLKTYGALSERQAARFAVPILKGLSEAHYQGIIHRDIKPSNLMVTKDYRGRNTMRILDFGIAIEQKRAKNVASPTRVGEFVGSLQYASPEQFVGDASPQSDLYSLGATLYEVVTRKRLCPERDFDTCLIAHTSPDPWTIETDTDGFADILRRALAKSRADRYPTAEAMLEDIQAWMRDPTMRFLSVEPV